MASILDITNSWNPTDPTVEELLAESAFDTLRQFTGASNYVFLASMVDQSGNEGFAVYKPVAGEQYLWDFESGLHLREVAAYELSKLLGWNLIPPTVIRQDGPHGNGSLQLFIGHDPSTHFFTMEQDINLPENPDRAVKYSELSSIEMSLMELAVFDYISNNADRKAGHVLIDEKQRIWGIDNGLCFHRENKLRTVIWNFAGIEFDSKLIIDLQRTLEFLSSPIDMNCELYSLISSSELESLLDRIQTLLTERTLPAMPSEFRAFPWPLI